MMNSDLYEWINLVESEKVAACKEQHLLIKYIRNCFETEEIYVDEELLGNYLGLTKYFDFDSLFSWEKFCLCLHLCTFWKETNLPRFPDLFLLIGRGAGKDGYIAIESFCLVSPYHKIKKYDVDICANAEEQAMRPMKDVMEVLEDTRNRLKLKKHFYWTKEMITGLKYKGVIKGRTNNPKSKDGMRSGMVVFNEIHQYVNYDNIKVFKTGLGKKAHPRQLFATTNGDVREGPLDEYLEKGIDILNGEIPDNGFLPFICRLDSKEEANSPDMWVKANPSLMYLPTLKNEILDEFNDWKLNPEGNADFMTKRMNLPQSAADVKVVDYAYIKNTNKDLPDLCGQSCVCGVDYASISDFASVDLRFVIDGVKYDINHSWFCLQSKDKERIKAPLKEWEAKGLLTFVDDVEISPNLLTDWILEKGSLYNIKKVAIDNYRYSLVSYALNEIGFDAKERKNVFLVKPSDIMKVVPVVKSDFLNKRLIWGNNPVLRWATNNTKVVNSSRKIGSDTGNQYYAKIEPRSRKTDPFMATVAAACVEDVLQGATSPMLMPVTW